MAIQWIENLDEHGLITDRMPERLPINAFSDVENMRFVDGKALRIGGNDLFINGDDTVWHYGFWVQADSFANDGQFLLIGAGTTYRQIAFKNTETELTLTAHHGSGANEFYPMHHAYLNGHAVINTGWASPEVVVGSTGVIPGWDANWRAQVIRPYKKFLVALNMTESGTEYPNKYRWSNIAVNRALPTTWTPAAGNSAGFDILDRAEHILWAEELGDHLMIYTESSVHELSFTGDIFVMAERRLFTGAGILAPRCALEWQNKHFVFDRGKVYLHDKRNWTDILSGRAYEKIFGDLVYDRFYQKNAFVAENREHEELLCCFPDRSSTTDYYCTRAAVWNWRTDTWSTRTLPGETRFIALGREIPSTIGIQQLAVDWKLYCTSGGSFSDQDVYMLDADGYDDEYAASGDMECYIERTGWRPPGARGDERWLLSAVYPIATGGAAYSIYVGAHNSPGESFTYSGPYSWTPSSGEDKINCRVSGRYLAYKIVYPVQAAGAISAIGLDVTPVGSR